MKNGNHQTSVGSYFLTLTGEEKNIKQGPNEFPKELQGGEGSLPFSDKKNIYKEYLK